MDENSKYQALFFEETDEYLEVLNDRILLLEENPEDTGLIDEIFRAAHTLKGMAATMGYNDMADLTHHMENILELFRDGTMKVSTDVISLIFECLDVLSGIVEDLRSGNTGEADVEDLINRLETAREDRSLGATGKQEATNLVEGISKTDLFVIEEAKKQGYTGYDLLIKVSKDCELKGARAFLVITKLEEFGQIISSFPAVEELQDGNYDESFRLIYLSEDSIEHIEQVVMGNVDIEGVNISMAEEKEVIEKERVEKETKIVKIEEEKEKKDSLKKKSKPVVNSMNQSIRVQIDKLDHFMNLVSELVIYRTRLEDIMSRHDDNKEVVEPLAQVSKITSDLQNLVLSIRMEAVDVVFSRFPRMIRDLAKDLDKDIDLIIEGETTELDRTVVSEIGEPLVHLIRNAADHGIETKSERLAKGKPEQGTINLKAYQEGNRVVILVKDDGKGIDPMVIKESAERKGIDTEGLTDGELVELIFHKGFSTNKDVTSVSGRGVGMDVVKQKISMLGGTIEVLSKKDEGSSFIIKLPLSLLIIQALLVEVGSEIFAVSLELIERVIEVDRSKLVESSVGKLYNLDDETIPILVLSEAFNLEPKGEGEHLILASIDGKRYGVVIDGFIGQQDIVIKELGKTIKNKRDFIGATILGSGDIILIVDIISMINSMKGEKDD